MKLATNGRASSRAPMVMAGNFSQWLQAAPNEIKPMEIVTLSIELPSADWMALQAYAAQNGETLTECIESCLASSADMAHSEIQRK